MMFKIIITGSCKTYVYPKQALPFCCSFPARWSGSVKRLPSITGGHVQGLLQLHSHIRLSLSTVNRSNIKSQICNRIIKKGFSFYNKRILILLLYYAVPFYFSYFDSACLICYLLATEKPVTFNFFAKLYPANYINT